MASDEETGRRAAGSPAAGGQIDTDRRSSAQRSTGAGGRRASGTPPQTPKDDDDRRREAGRRVWHFVAYIVVALIALYLFQQYLLGPMVTPSNHLEYSEFKTAVAAGQIRKAVIGENQIKGTMADPRSTTGGTIDFETSYQAGGDEQLVPALEAAGVAYSFSEPASPIGGILISLLPFLIIGVLWYFIYRRMAGVPDAPTDVPDLPIPGSGYSFGVLKRAQAIGDSDALRDAGRRVVRVDIGEDVARGLGALAEALDAALSRRAAQ